MWNLDHKYSADHQKLIWAAGTTSLILVSAWIVGALASPTPMKSGLYKPQSGLHSPGSSSPVAAPPAVPPQVFEQMSPQQALQINASTPFSALPNPAAHPFKLEGASLPDRARAQTCLTMAVYYEAAGQSDQGQAAVAQVVLNRLRNPLFPKTICGVVFEGSTLPTGCQFTFTCDGSLGRPPSQAGWKHASQIAERALDGYVQKDVGEATHYHTVWVVPYWRPTLVKLTQIGAHIFYRWSGGLGLPGAFQGQYAGGEPSPAPINGFDTGLQPVVEAKIDETAPAAVTALAAAPTPITAPADQPVQVAMLTTDVPAPVIGPIQPPVHRRDGYFARVGGGDDGQHLPVAAHW
jgi:spore germination cell wall hydrolase CwlJ-like protein